MSCAGTLFELLFGVFGLLILAFGKYQVRQYRSFGPLYAVTGKDARNLGLVLLAPLAFGFLCSLVEIAKFVYLDAEWNDAFSIGMAISRAVVLFTTTVTANWIFAAKKQLDEPPASTGDEGRS